MRKKRPVVLLLLLIISHVVDSQDTARIGLNGYLKFLHEADVLHHPDTLLTGQLLHQRMNFRADAGSGWHFRASLRTRFYYGQNITLVPDFSQLLKQRQQLVDLQLLLVDEEEAVLFMESDRLNISWQDEHWNICLGRQRVNWGINLLWNPLDIFNTYDILDFDYEERSGTDAVRIRYNTNENFSIDLAAAPKSDSNSVYAGLIRSHAGSYDLQWMAGMVNQQPVTGFGWAGNIGEMGFKGEVAWYPTKNRMERQLSLATTLDYGPGRGWYTYVSVLYQEKTLTGTTNLIENTRIIPPDPKMLMPFHWSVYVGASKQLGAAWSTQSGFILGEPDNHLILTPSITCEATQDLDLLLTSQIYLAGEEAWGFTGGSVFLRMKYSF
ncbi:MAG: hypothetical protein ACKO1U_10130 [Bacteroidota bacterium]